MKKGRFFHTYQNDALLWQGVVLSTTRDYLEVQLFSWLSGEPTDILVIRKSEAVWNDSTKTGWKFYTNREHWLETANEVQDRQDQRRRRLQREAA
jgi:hypothetical protein